PGFWNTASTLISNFARTAAIAATMPGRSRTTNRKKYGAVYSPETGRARILRITGAEDAEARVTRSEITATAVASPPAPGPENAVLPPNLPWVRTTFSQPCARASGELA